MYIISLVGIIIVVITGINSLWIYLLFSVGWLLSFTIRNLLIYNTDSYTKLAFLTYFIEFLLLMWLGKIGAGESIKLLLLISFADCCIVWGLTYGAAFYVAIILGYITIMNGMLSSQTVKGMLLIIIKESPTLLLTGVISYLIGKILKGNLLLENSIKEREDREVKLRAAYHDLNLAYENLEEISTLKERNRIAREIHDTVGHTLTTVIVEMEAGKMLSDKEPNKAKEKYSMAHAQAVKALDEMRYSVRMLADHKILVNLKQAVIDTIEESCRHADVIIKYEIELPDNMNTKFDELIVRALKEGISNSIRHGKSTAFFFKLNFEENKLYFLLQDNGIGRENIVPGFGLSNMKQSIEQARGKITFRTESEEGFEIEIVLPLNNKE